MNIKVTTLGELPMVYAIAAVPRADGLHFLAATELYGRWLHFSPPHYHASIASEGPGGVMSIVPLRGKDGSVVVIERAYPIYHGDDSRISIARPPAQGTGLWEKQVIADVPFLHRLAVIDGPGSSQTLVAATMVSGKRHQDDWSQPGQVLAATLSTGGGPLRLLPIVEKLSRNHGMYLPPKDGVATLLVSGIEGLFALSRAGDQWSSRQLLAHDVSDVAIFDLDGDGRDEVITIEPFHGNRFVIYRDTGAGLEKAVEIPGAFGHVVWAGWLRGQRSLVLGDRAGRKELRLLTFRGDSSLQFETTVLDSGGGPANIVVIHEPKRDLILSANHARGDVSLFELT